MALFHDKTFGMLGAKQRTSATAVDEVMRAEERLEVPLPPSVREWYAFGDAIQTLASHSNDDPPIPVRHFALQEWNSETILPFRYENQGVCEWCVLLDGTDDPPVYVNVDDSGWHILAPTFSDYVYSCVWDYAVVLQKATLVHAQGAPLTDNSIRALAIEFAEEVRTYGFPGSVQYRFAGDKQGVMIWSGQAQADWFAAADDANAWRSLLRTLWPLDGVGKRFFSDSDVSNGVLNDLQNQSELPFP